MSARSLIQRSAVLVGLLLLSVFLFYIGKGHTLLIDTNAVTIGDKEYRSAETVSISINGLPAETMGRAERVMLAVGGPSHSITIEVISGPEKVVTQKFAIPISCAGMVIPHPPCLIRSCTARRAFSIPANHLFRLEFRRRHACSFFFWLALAAESF